MLLERESLLDALTQALGQATAGHGRTVLVTGEAGIGKTSLVEHFVAQQPTATRVLWGACEALFTPRPLGPLYDIAPQMGRAFRDLLLPNEAHRAALFAAFLQDLCDSPLPNLFIIEDVHWADEATMDLIKFLGRRLHRLRLLLVLTYRDDELGAEHPLRLVIGDLPSTATLRLRLPSLSAAAVARLAAPTGHDAADIYNTACGNPFFVTELLAATTMEVPATVRDAVLARAARLSPLARSLLEVAAVIPNRIEPWLLDAVCHPAPTTLAECLTSGMLRLEKEVMSFRHELTRMALESALTSSQRQAAHLRVVRAWLAHEVVPPHYARVLHHAAQAQDRALVQRFAPLAAQYAAQHGAHREAASHYATALEHAAGLPLAERATWLEAHAYECYLTGQMATAEASRREALALWQQDARRDKEGDNLRWLSRLNWFLGRSAEAEQYAAQAVAVLESLPATAELAMAYSNMAQLRMLAADVAEAVVWGHRAIALAERYGDVVTVVHALNNIGTAELQAGDATGRATLERSLALAREHELEEHVARAYANLVSTAIVWRDYAQATRDLADGIAYTTEHDLDAWVNYLRAWQARALLETGHWDAAAREANAVLSHPLVAPISKLPALVVLGQIRMRRDDPGGWPLLEEAHAMAQRTGELQRIAPVAAARAEVAWLQHQLDRCQQAVRPAFALAVERPNPWDLGLMAYWLWRADALPVVVPAIASPFAQQIAGDWQGAAQSWAQLGCPYEHALALADGDAPAQRQALALLEGLDARPAADLVRQRLRAQGARQIPRGPRATTQQNPLGLTNRQLEVLVLLASGLPNATIARRLSTATKTIDHHVSAILLKLGVQSRAEAIAKAYQMGIIAPAVPTNMGKTIS